MFIVILIFLILFSAFFSASETGMMAVNRYRLRHLSRQSHKNAKRVLKLLERPDRLLGVILIGNTFFNVLASAIATMLAMKWFGDMGAIIATIVLTLIILIFGETAPKTVAALHSQGVALWVARPLALLLKIFYPLVWLVNGIANAVLFCFGVRVDKRETDTLSSDELRSIVRETMGRAPSQYQTMLLRVLDLRRVTVEEVMIPKKEIQGIDLNAAWDNVVQQLKETPHAHLPLYRGHMDTVQGVVVVHDALLALSNGTLNAQTLLSLSTEPYFIPGGALLHQQLLNFQQERKRFGLVVDEYGDLQGLLTLKDLLEEIVGDFAAASDTSRQIVLQKDGSFLIDGSINIRELNRLMHWQLPVNGPRTLSGVIIHYLESIPSAAVSVRMAELSIEVLSVSKNMIQRVRIYPQHYRKP